MFSSKVENIKVLDKPGMVEFYNNKKVYVFECYSTKIFHIHYKGGKLVNILYQVVIFLLQIMELELEYMVLLKKQIQNDIIQS